jgi:hypothetical protein
LWFRNKKQKMSNLANIALYQGSFVSTAKGNFHRRRKNSQSPVKKKTVQKAASSQSPVKKKTVQKAASSQRSRSPARRLSAAKAATPPRRSRSPARRLSAAKAATPPRRSRSPSQAQHASKVEVPDFKAINAKILRLYLKHFDNTRRYPSAGYGTEEQKIVEKATDAWIKAKEHGEKLSNKYPELAGYSEYLEMFFREKKTYPALAEYIPELEQDLEEAKKVIRDQTYQPHYNNTPINYGKLYMKMRYPDGF